MESSFEYVLILLAVAVAVVVLFRRFHLPTILGYLAVGVLVGPHALGWIPDTDDIRTLAEFGVVFLLFTIGLEFSLPRLLHMRHALLGLGGAQVLLTALITSVIGVLLGMSVEGAVAVGAVVAMSSTAIVTKQLSDQHELHTRHGRNAIGILLLQDLAVVPLLIVVASFTGADDQPLSMVLLWALLKGIVALAVILGLGRWALRPLFRWVAHTHSTELFTLTALLVTLGCAWVTHRMGLSLALGAFVGGIMLAETEFRHQLEANLRPFRDVLLALFFITIGMLLDVGNLPNWWRWVALLFAALVLFKMALIALLARIARADNVTALRTGLVLAQSGEFGFAILSVALHGRLMPPDYGQVVLAALFFSMALSPLLIRYNGAIANALFPSAARVDEGEVKAAVSGLATGLENHVIVCGYGRIGQQIGRYLDEEGLPFLALDLDPVRVQNARLAGEPVSFGDASHPDILEAAALRRARAVVVSIDDPGATLRITRHVHRAHPELPVLVRTREHAELERLREAGATEVVPETHEASLMLASRLLFLLGVPGGRVLSRVQRARDRHYPWIHSDQRVEDVPDSAPVEQVRPVIVAENAPAVGHTLGELGLTGVRITAIRRPRDALGAESANRPEDQRPEPDSQTRLRAGDVLILSGPPDDLDRAERFMATG
ncbi:MAG: potassium transporter [Gammaproteobacteria bacterium]|nr:potassium transporter [Gammaproteobacteria bacterium]